jgi:hypothetical protein
MTMEKRKKRKALARTTISSVNREMQKPRLTESVRNDGKDPAASVATKPSTRSEKV